MDACEIADLKCVKIITEPVAAAMAYGITKKKGNPEDQKYFLVYDFGGGTLDVTILLWHRGTLKVQTIQGDNHLGGQDFDVLIMDWAIAKWNDENPNLEITDEHIKEKARLRKACTDAKEALTEQLNTEIHIEAFIGEEDLKIDLSRADFETDICRTIFAECMIPVT